jgi:hypothetical protein
MSRFVLAFDLEQQQVFGEALGITMHPVSAVAGGPDQPLSSRPLRNSARNSQQMQLAVEVAACIPILSDGLALPPSLAEGLITQKVKPKPND